jgi:hypothetical protein
MAVEQRHDKLAMLWWQVQQQPEHHAKQQADDM